MGNNSRSTLESLLETRDSRVNLATRDRINLATWLRAISKKVLAKSQI